MLSLTVQRLAACLAKVAVDFAQGGEPLAVMLSEVTDRLVVVEPQELSNGLDGKYLRVGEPRSGAAPSEASRPFELVVDKAEDRDYEGAKIHRKGPPSLRSVWVPPSVGRSHFVIQPLKEPCTWGY